jgi:hypothetical protein
MRAKFKVFCFIGGLILAFPCFPLGLLLLGTSIMMDVGDKMDTRIAIKDKLRDQTFLEKDDPT